MCDCRPRVSTSHFADALWHAPTACRTLTRYSPLCRTSQCVRRGRTPGLTTNAGEKPVIDVAAWTALKPNRQEKLLEDGLVKIEPIIKGAYHGRVEAKLHAPT